MALANIEVPAPDLTGRRVLITDADSGIGYGLAARFASAGAHVIMAVRNSGKGDAARRRIEAAVPAANRVTYRLPVMGQPVATGILPALFTATSPNAVGGGYYGPAGIFELTRGVRPARVPARALDESARRCGRSPSG